MKRSVAFSLAAVLVAGTAAVADPTLQMDINNMHFQALDSGGNATSFNGTSHTGAMRLDFDADFSRLVDISISDGLSGSGSGVGAVPTLTGFSGLINLSNGQVTGGNLSVTVEGGGTYTAQIGSGGGVDNFVGGGFTIEGLTFDGNFSSADFGGVDVTPWFNGQDGPQSLLGSFLTFIFDPTAGGDGYADMDLFVVVPLPPAGWAGMATLAGVMGLGYIRRRRLA